MTHPIKIRNQQANKRLIKEKRKPLFWFMLEDRDSEPPSLSNVTWLLDIPRRHPQYIVTSVTGTLEQDGISSVHILNPSQKIPLPNIDSANIAFKTPPFRIDGLEYSDVDDAIMAMSSYLIDLFSRTTTTQGELASRTLDSGVTINNWYIKAARMPVSVLTKWVKQYKIETLLEIKDCVASSVTLLGDKNKGILEILREELFKKGTTDEGTTEA